jgi:hypothetical protein
MTMNKVLELIKAGPKLAGVEQHERWAFSGEKLSPADASEQNSPLARQPDESFESRAQVWDWRQYATDYDTAEHIWWLFELMDRSAQGDINDEEMSAIATIDGEFPAVDAIVKPSEAARVLAWSPSSDV